MDKKETIECPDCTERIPLIRDIKGQIVQEELVCPYCPYKTEINN